MSARVPSVVVLARATSTMDVLHELAQGGAPAGSAVVAEEQEGGRGSRGRGWLSPPGGLWLSVLARPAAAGLELLSLRAGLAVAERLDELGLASHVRLKWPNDLMLGERKAGGILCEARWQGAAPAWVVIGLGLNVTNRPPASLETSAAWLALARPSLTAPALVGPMVEALRGIDAAAGPLTDDELGRYARRDWLRGRALLAPVAGTGDGLAPDGGLLVRAADGSKMVVRAGTVVLAGPHATADLPSCS
jgi:BirA family transcriptional regulator, biotin operon repressor / biotin---[acetyl-CoA-carboxylase] ligase